MHPDWIRQLIIKAVGEDPEISTVLQHDVEQVERRGQSFVVEGSNGQGPWKCPADVVVNCLWEGRQKIDRALNVDSDGDWITRVKYGFVLEGPSEVARVPSMVITHGPFGDVVHYPYDNTVYVTWYPACLTYIGHTDRLPDVWEEACEGNHESDCVRRIFSESIEALSEYVPEIRSLTLKRVMAGSIVGRGKTDISDRESGLHRRHGIGIETAGDYHSIFTGKFTSAPANAIALQAVLA